METPIWHISDAATCRVLILAIIRKTSRELMRIAEEKNMRNMLAQTEKYMGPCWLPPN